MREQLENLRGESERGLGALVVIADELESVRSQVRGQATRMRMLALREAAELSEWVAELTRGPAEARERVVDALEQMLGRVSAADDLRELEPSGSGDEIKLSRTMPAPEPAEAEPAAEATDPVVAVPEAETVSGAEAQTTTVAARIAEDIFVGSIEIDVGPLSDFAQLVGLEDAVDAVPVVAEVAVKRFAQGRAILAVTLSEPVELVRELGERAPFAFAVRELGADRVVLDVAA